MIIFYPDGVGTVSASEVDRRLNDYFGGTNNRHQEFVALFGDGTRNIGNNAFEGCYMLSLIV
jgi:hypothetical protein